MENVFFKSFQIAGLTFLINSNIEFVCDTEFLKFETSKDPDYVIKFRKVIDLESFDSTPVAEETGFSVYDIDGKYIRQFTEIDHVPYAISKTDWDERKVTIQYLQIGSNHFSHIGGSFFHIGWEDILLREHRLILHACCVDTNLGGILFSGISGIGKSTQGRLWCDYEEARMINGDRPVLYRTPDGWQAYGSPYAGSSKCHVNESVKIRAIILLAQANTCFIRKLAGAEAFCKVFAQSTVGNWDKENVRIACDLSEQLVSEVPVYELICTPDRAAVNLLKETLLKEVAGDNG